MILKKFSTRFKLGFELNFSLNNNFFLSYLLKATFNTVSWLHWQLNSHLKNLFTQKMQFMLFKKNPFLTASQSPPFFHHIFHLSDIKTIRNTHDYHPHHHHHPRIISHQPLINQFDIEALVLTSLDDASCSFLKLRDSCCTIHLPLTYLCE